MSVLHSASNIMLTCDTNYHFKLAYHIRGFKISRHTLCIVKILIYYLHTISYMCVCLCVCVLCFLSLPVYECLFLPSRPECVFFLSLSPCAHMCVCSRSLRPFVHMCSRSLYTCLRSLSLPVHVCTLTLSPPVSSVFACTACRQAGSESRSLCSA